jgi:hypothetical protein
MLTPAQQKIRQELEELQVNGLLQPKQAPPLPAKKERSNNWSFYLIGILLLTIICLVYYIYFSNRQHANADTYLIKVQAYNAQSDELLADFIKQPETDGNIKKALYEQNRLLKKAIELKAPEDFKEYKQDFIEVINQRKNMLSTLAFSNKINLMELNVKKELAKESLERALQKAGIKYQVQEDGTLQYWIKSKPYQY